MRNKQQKKIFSVSSKYKEVMDILLTTPNQSEFICQAIIEKNNSTNNKQNSVSDEELKRKIKSVLAEMITDDNVIIASKGRLNNTTAIETPVHSVDITPEPNIDEENTDDIKNIVNMW